jgi:serine/threonine-protein kinase
MEDTLSVLSGGERIGNYEIQCLAGRGGMGCVYKAFDTKLNRLVALKFLPLHLTSSDKDRKRLLQEARSASALDHPNIGVVHGIEESSDGQPFIVMAYYEGLTLATRIAGGPIPVPETCDIFYQIVLGVSEAHRHNIIHRDIKPSNIILTRQGAIKVVDFGLALLVNDTEATRSLGIPGTPLYMAPEQIQRAPADRRSDIWALGIVLAEMLVGRHPFLRESFPSAIYAVLNDPPAELDETPQELQAVVYRALAKNPSRRYQTCAELQADLDRFRNQLRTTSSDQENAATPPRRNSVREFNRYLHDASEPVTFAPHHKSKILRRLTISFAAAFAVLAALWFSPAQTWIRNFIRPPQKHIAVLPLNNLGSTPINPDVADGLMESLTNKLSNLSPGKESVWVVPASVVRERRIDKPTIALRDLGVNYVVQGSITRDGQNVRLTLNLIDTKSLAQVGSIEVNDPAGDIRGLQEEAIRRLARILNIRPDTQPRADSSVPAAYEAYLKALSYLQRYDRRGNLELAISELQSAVKHDPQFALGYAELGEAYRLKYQQEHDRKWIDEALGNCKKASTLSNQLSVVYVTLGRIHNDAGNRDLAVEEFQHALDLDPRNPDALNGMAYAYESTGRMAEAEAAFKKSLALRPDYWDGYNSLGLFYNRQRRFNEAIAQLQLAQQLTPDNAEVYYNLAGVYLAAGSPQELAKAEEALKKSIELEPTYPALANLGFLYLQQKRYAESAEMTRRVLQINDKNFMVWENLDWAYRWMGMNDQAAAAREKALALLEQAVQSSPRDGQLQAHLALQYSLKRMRDKASTRVATALALAPDDPDVLANVSDTYEELGDHPQALRYAQLSLDKGFTLDDLRRDPDMRNVLADPSFRPKKQQ